MRQWEDFSYRLPDGECLDEVQKRNIAALNKVLEEYRDKNIVIGTHGTALSVIIKYFNDDYCWKDFEGIISKMPWAVKMIYDGKRFISAETVEI